MARPSNTPRLAAIDPSKIARDVAESVQSHLINVHMSLVGLWDSELPRLPEPEQTEIYRVVRMIAGYARGEHALDAPVQEYLVSLIGLWTAPLVQAIETGPIGLDTELGVVIHAAEGREALAAGQDVTTAQLAALGGYAQQAVALLCRQGEISADRVRDGWSVSAEEAQRWLASRPG